jgi:cell division protein FtsI (penicillin-binding protein 3)
VNSIEHNKHASVLLNGYTVAGKTGTSRKPKAKGYSSQVYTSFVGYYPASNPEVVTMVVVDSPSIAEAWGSTVAGPIFQKIAQETTHYLNIKPDKPFKEMKTP